ncbi:MAG: hypothetical protein EXS05_13495 [Planctomycetaceae bacterium]|nr:hypothetical protein [Planctomycetaceae bacterium]
MVSPLTEVFNKETGQSGRIPAKSPEVFNKPRAGTVSASFCEGRTPGGQSSSSRLFTATVTIPTMPVSRKAPAGFGIVVAMVGLLFGYPLSFGPACWAVARGLLPESQTALIYDPMLRLRFGEPNILQGCISSYVSSFGVLAEIKTLSMSIVRNVSDGQLCGTAGRNWLVRVAMKSTSFRQPGKADLRLVPWKTHCRPMDVTLHRE